MTKKRTGYFAALAAGIVVLTACTEDSAAERDEQEHIEHLQELDEAQKMLDTYDEWNDASEPVPTDSPSPTPEQSDIDPQEWADKRAAQYRQNYLITYNDVCYGKVETLGGCGTEDPHSSITDISAPEVGYLEVQVEDGSWKSGWAADWPAEYVASGMMTMLAYETTDVEEITVVLPDGRSYTEQWSSMAYEGYYGATVRPATRE
ncbi:MAG TPA: hypothetical protein VIG67_07415 [Yaniella sp.]